MNKITNCPSDEGKTRWGFMNGKCDRHPENTDYEICEFCWAWGNWRYNKLMKECEEFKQELEQVRRQYEN